MSVTEYTHCIQYLRSTETDHRDWNHRSSFDGRWHNTEAGVNATFRQRRQAHNKMNLSMWNLRKLPFDCFLVLCIVTVTLIISETLEQTALETSFCDEALRPPDKSTQSEPNVPLPVKQVPLPVKQMTLPTKQTTLPTKLMPLPTKTMPVPETKVQQQHRESQHLPGALPVIDMISIGSDTRPHYQTVQQETFGRHAAVRHFYKITEANDTHTTCHNMTVAQAENVYDICKRPSTYRSWPLMRRHLAPRKWLFGGVKQKNPVGWLCAQRRPLDALQGVLSNYAAELEEYPDYLFVMDDDSWFHLDSVLVELTTNHPASKAELVAGCLIRSPKDERFTFYWGGFGLVLTKTALHRLLTPLQCVITTKNKTEKVDYDPNTEDTHNPDFASETDFTTFACQQLQRNLLGEAYFYKPGMSLQDVLFAYHTQQPYHEAAQWREDATYCMHSDTTLAYFLQAYHVGTHGRNNATFDAVPYERIQAYRGSVKIKSTPDEVIPPQYESRQECLHLSDKDCTVASHLCHYVTPEHMQALFRKVVATAPAGRYRMPTTPARATTIQSTTAQIPKPAKKPKTRKAAKQPSSETTRILKTPKGTKKKTLKRRGQTVLVIN